MSLPKILCCTADENYHHGLSTRGESEKSNYGISDDCWVTERRHSETKIAKKRFTSLSWHASVGLTVARSHSRDLTLSCSFAVFLCHLCGFFNCLHRLDYS